MIAALDKTTTVGKVVQILIGLVLSYLVFLLGVTIINSDKFENSEIEKREKLSIEVLDGFADSSSLSLISFNTVLPYLDNYLPLKPSVNIKGGSQFSFSFWLSIHDASNADLLNKCIFMMGDKQKYTYTTTNIQDIEVSTNDFLVYCPYFGFGENELDFVVRFNSSHHVDTKLYAQRFQSPENDAYRNNLLSILRNNWMMFTLIFEDNMPMNDFENGTRVQLYLNDIMYQTEYFPGMMKQNKGNLYFFPDGALAGIRLSNMKYFNYAISGDEIKQLFRNPPNTSKPSSLVRNNGANTMKVDVSSKNLLNYYNI